MRGVVERSELGGIPVFSTPDGTGAPIAGMVFRVGKMDETAATAGVTHLVEHLALPAHARHTLDFNGTVEPFVTSFYATGDVAELREFLTATARMLVDLPLERFEIERRILLAEDATRGSGGARAALKLRYGPVGAGLLGYDEYGLKRLRAEDVAAWAAGRFTRRNAALWAVGIDLGGVELPLSQGSRLAPPQTPRPLADLTTPALYAAGWDTGFCLSFLGSRSRATALALDVLADDLRDRLRYEAGLSYSIEGTSQPLSADTAHVVITADVADERADDWLTDALDVIRRLAADGCDEEHLEVVKGRYRRYEREPADAIGFAAWSADEELLGGSFRRQSALTAEREAVTTRDVAETVAGLYSSLLVLGPDATTLPEGLTDYPYTPPDDRVEGRQHLPAGSRLRLRRRVNALVSGPEGVSLVPAEGTSLTARYARTVLCIRSGRTRTLLTDDGFYVPIDASDWRDGPSVVEEIDAAIPAERVVSDDPALDAGRAAVDTLAAATFKRTFLVSDELERLPGLLEEGETLVALGAASRGWRYGLVALTDRRFHFLYKESDEHSFSVARRSLPARARSSTLEVFVDDTWVALTDVSPKGKAQELEQLLHAGGDLPAT
jgi:predicted Zn-dependent peptidase